MTKAFCIGQAKSGTASLYGLLAKRYHAAHEPERKDTLDHILMYGNNLYNKEEHHAWLYERDKKLNLNYDIAWANQFLLPHLVDCFPETKFIALIREPYPWIHSIIGHFMSREIPEEVWQFMDWWFRPDQYPHSKEDIKLKERKIYSVEAFLQAWNRHIETFESTIPADRLLILKTSEIPDCKNRLAEFLEINSDTLDFKNSHLNQSTWEGRLSEFFAKDYLKESIDRICRKNIEKYFNG